MKTWQIIALISGGIFLLWLISATKPRGAPEEGRVVGFRPDGTPIIEHPYTVPTHVEDYSAGTGLIDHMRPR